MRRPCPRHGRREVETVSVSRRVLRVGEAVASQGRRSSRREPDDASDKTRVPRSPPFQPALIISRRHKLSIKK